MLAKLKRLVASIYASERKIGELPGAIGAQIGAQTHAIVGAIQSRPLSILAMSDIIFASEQRDPKHILQTPTHFFSQNYEDAIISEIFSRIGTKSKVFVEIGVESGAECNTRLLLEQGWSGLWVEGSPEYAAAAKSGMSKFIESGQLVVIQAMVTPENIQSLIDGAIGEREIDFFSLDIDYNTSHAWRHVTSKYRVACIEYNPSVPPSTRFEVDYDANRSWNGDNWYGASLKVLEDIGREKGMSLVGCDFHGVNAFFVADEECEDKFLEPFTAEKHYSPPRYHLIAHRGHPMNMP